MKTSSATVKLIQLTSKQNKKGECRIVVRISHHGTRDVSTGITCTPKQWDAKHELIKGKGDDIANNNQILQDIRQKVINRRCQLEKNGTDYSVQDLIPNSTHQSSQNLNSRSNLIDIIDVMMVKGKFAKRSRDGYNDSYRSFASFINISKPTLNDVTLPALKSWAKKDKERGLENQTIVNNLYRFHAIMHFCVDEHLIPNSPYDGWKYRKDYKVIPHHKSLTDTQIRVIESYLTLQLQMSNGGFISQQIATFGKFENGKLIPDFSHSSYSSQVQLFNTEHLLPQKDQNIASVGTLLGTLVTFYLGYKCQGLALCDLADMRFSDFEFTTIDNYKYIIYSTKRKKTNVPVKIILEYTPIVQYILTELDKTSHKRDNHVLPILYRANPRLNNEVNVYKNNQWYISTNLKRLWNKINSIMATSNIEGWTPIPGDITFYSQRHTFATLFMQRGGQSHNLATLMGRSPAGIERYCAELTSVEDIIKVKNSVGM